MKNFSLAMKALCLAASCMLYVSCSYSTDDLKTRVLELCKHIPDVEHLERSKGALTEDFYALLEEMINLPDETPVLHQWEFWFVAADGSAIAGDECEVLDLWHTDRRHAMAVILVTPSETDYLKEEHTLYLKKEKGSWLITDYDMMKGAARRYINNYRKAIRPLAH